MSKSNYAKEKQMDHVLGAVAYTPPASYFLRLHTVTPDLDGSGTEVSTDDWTNYAPVEVDNDKVTWASAATLAGVTLLSNAINIEFSTPVVTVPSINVTGVSLWDAASGGNMWFVASLSTPKLIYNGQPALFLAGSLNFSESDCS